jgi:hypothetical protein
MGRRGENAFRRNDAVRALESARAAGLEPAALEVVLGADGGVTFRVLGESAALKGTDTACVRVWNEEIAKLKAATPKERGNRDQASPEIRPSIRRP